MVLSEKEEVIEKSPFKTLLSTSEGLGKVLFWGMVIYGMVTGEIEFMHGLGLLGAEQLGYTGIRQWAKARENEAGFYTDSDDQLDQIRTELLEIVEDRRNNR